VNREVPTFMRQQEKETVPLRQQRAFLMDDEDQFDIPTFLRKSVD
jgi:cell division protein FtsZ